MAKYKLQEMPDVHNTGERKVYPKIVVNRTMSLSDIVDKMKFYHRAWSPSVIEGVLMDVSDMLANMLSMGYNVKLDGIGTFSLSLDFEDNKPTEMQGDDDKMIYRKVGVKNVNFKSDPEFVKQVKLKTDHELERDMAGVKVIKKSLYSKEERVARALGVIERDGLITLTDYANINHISRTAASQELKMVTADAKSVIKSVGSGSHKVWVKRILACLMSLLGLFGHLSEGAYAQNAWKVRESPSLALTHSEPVAQTDMQQIREYVKNQFSEWCSKGEFEKAAAVEERLQKYGKSTFDKICMTAVEARIYQLKNAFDVSQRSISTYDSENETFDMTLVLNGKEVKQKINVPINKAQQFKADFWSLPIYCGKEWCDVAGNIYPKSIRVVDTAIQYSTDISLDFNAPKPIVIAFDELGMANPYIVGHDFNYDAALGDPVLSAVANTMSIASLPDAYRADYENEKVFDVVEVMPRFQGGTGAMNAFLKGNMKYPVVARENGVQGRVIVEFVVEKDGSLSHFGVVRSVDASLDREAIRLAMSMPRWIPGMQNGQAVRVRYTVPVSFRL